MPPHSPRVRWLSPRRLGALVTALATLTLLVILLGCMSLSIGGRSVTQTGSDNDVYCQEGRLELGAPGKRTVYYPAPYASIPNLEVKSSFFSDSVDVIEQTPTHFTVGRKGFGSAITVNWTARGVRAPVAVPPVVIQTPQATVSPPPVPPPTELPPMPIPVPAPTPQP